MKACKNCSKSFDQNFCNHCGQKYIDKRYTLKESIGWVFSSIFNFEKGFLYTTKVLFQNPKKLISGYLNGITVCYFHPFRFVFVWATISAIIAIFTNTYDEIGQITSEMNGQDGLNGEFGKSYGEFLKKYMSLLTMGMIPLLSIFTKLFYRKRGLYFTEHLILNSYSLSATIVIGIIPTLFYFMLDHDQMKMAMYLSILLVIVVSGYIYSRFFEENILLSVLKYALAYLFTLILIAFMVIIIVIIHVILIKFVGLEDVYAPLVETAKVAGEAAKAVQDSTIVE